MWFPFFLLIILSFIPILHVGAAGFIGAIVGTVGLASLLLVQRIAIPRRTLVVVLGGLMLFNAPYNMQRIVYQLLTIVSVALFFVSFDRLDRRGRIRCVAVIGCTLLGIMAYYASVADAGLNEAYADWAIISAVPFYFLVRLVDRRWFTVSMCLVFGYLLILLQNIAGLSFPAAVLGAWLLPRRARATRALVAGLAASFTITVVVVTFALFIPHQGLFMRGMIWNEMLLRWSSSPMTLIFGVERFLENGYTWLVGADLLRDPRVSGAEYILFSEMTHNYVLAVLVFGGLKGMLLAGAFLWRSFKPYTFERRVDLAMFLAVFVYLTMDGFKLLSPDGVSISSAILLYSSVRALTYFDAPKAAPATAPCQVPGWPVAQVRGVPDPRR